MNKLTKASIAGAAGIALLLGGAGTLALWNDAASVTGETINSGELTIGTPTGAWDANLALWAPGNSYEYNGTVTVSVLGSDLNAELSVGSIGITGDPALLAAIDVEFDVVGLSETAPNSGVFALDGTFGSNQVVTFTITVTFDASTSGTTAQDEQIVIGAIELLLQQV